MTTVNIYLNFNGNCEAAFHQYQSVFGGEFAYVGRFNEMPPQPGMKPMSKEEGEKIMHISLPISKETTLMGSDTGGESAPAFVQGNNFSISVNAESKADADRFYEGLSAGGQRTLPMAKTFWSEYFGMLTDRFSINWMISFDGQSPA